MVSGTKYQARRARALATVAGTACTMRSRSSGEICVSPKLAIADAVGGLLDVRLLRYLGGGEQGVWAVSTINLYSS